MHAPIHSQFLSETSRSPRNFEALSFDANLLFFLYLKNGDIFRFPSCMKAMHVWSQ